MNKLGAIRKAYGDQWENVKYHVDENGFIEAFLWDKLKLGYPNQATSKSIYRYFRPISLAGIENNNGWTKIESKHDLPKESGWYDFQSFPKETYVPNLSYWYKGDVRIGWFVESYTHFKRIDNLMPIY